jgi:hypothetical protein
VPNKLSSIVKSGVYSKRSPWELDAPNNRGEVKVVAETNGTRQYENTLEEVNLLNWLGREFCPRSNPAMPSKVPKLAVSLFMQPKMKFEMPISPSVVLLNEMVSVDNTPAIPLPGVP